MSDELHKFLFEGLPVRGMLVRLGPSWREVQARREAQDAYPSPVRHLHGKKTEATKKKQTNIKFETKQKIQSKSIEFFFRIVHH